MTALFTPGPWEMGQTGDYETALVAPRSRATVAYAAWDGGSGCHLEIKNDADHHLIAAAPDLYAALVKARDQFLFYEQSHLAKYAPWDLEMLRKGVVDVPQGRDAYEKAQTNAAFAAMCDAALAKASPSARSSDGVVKIEGV